MRRVEGGSGRGPDDVVAIVWFLAVLVAVLLLEWSVLPGR